MPVDSQHAEYKSRIDSWKLCRAVCDGEEAVKAEDVREVAIPRLSGHKGETKAYEAYVQHAYFFPGVSRALDLFKGVMHRVPPKVTAPESAKPFLEDATGASSPITVEEYKQQVDVELLKVGRCGTLTDYPTRQGTTGDEVAAEPRDLTKAEVERLGMRPTWTLYTAEQIINWDFAKLRGRRVLSLLVLSEDKTVQDKEDEFERYCIEQWRVLDREVPPDKMAAFMPPEGRVEAGGDGKVYRVRIYRRKEEGATKEDQFEQVASSFPLKDGKFLTEIPFDPHGAEEGTFKVSNPPLRAAVGVNIAHLRNSAAFEHALLFVGNPQAIITGYDADTEEELQDEPEPLADDNPVTRHTIFAEPQTTAWRLGSAEILLLKNENARPSILSLKSEDVSALRDAMNAKREELVMMVGRMLVAESQANIAQRTEELQRTGDEAVISSIAAKAAKSLSRSLRRAVEWMGGDASEEATSIVSNTDYFARTLAPQEALAIADMCTKGFIAMSDVRDLLRRGNWIRPDRTDDEIDQEIAETPPPVSANPLLLPSLKPTSPANFDPTRGGPPNAPPPQPPPPPPKAPAKAPPTPPPAKG